MTLPLLLLALLLETLLGVALLAVMVAVIMAMAKKNKLRISLIDLIYLAYVIELLTGRTLYDLVASFLTHDGTITDKVLQVGLDTLARVKAEGLEIVVDLVVVTAVKDKVIRPIVGHKKIIDLGFAVLTL